MLFLLKFGKIPVASSSQKYIQNIYRFQSAFIHICGFLKKEKVPVLQIIPMRIS